MAMKRAVALRYAPDKNVSPMVVAKGKGHVADTIIRKAKEHGVTLQEDPSLVEVLSKLDLKQEIPPELYQLVAEILSFVYRTDSRAKAEGDGGA
ncbi:FhlB domain-containing protein [Paenibacillus ginsengarvi]|uniref:FhlB domain-containing protein n=2 Tax=Paenibacillus ginsengarvi TaxID=400777 RepID=A0A3B0D049_9BACL|nr:FhlB domain-containing protein [Paenibacillus ginsengarvi]